MIEGFTPVWRTPSRAEAVAILQTCRAWTDSRVRWLEKIPSGRGRSALGLILAKALNGDKYGFFAHDFAHGRGLEAAVAALTAART